MSDQNLDKLRHSCSHLLAAAVMELFPKALLTLGPAIENGFYYDIDFGKIKISEDDLSKIEAKMHAIAPSWQEFREETVTYDQAKKDYANNPYKLELIDEHKEHLTYYHSGNFTDLCAGGHLEKPFEIKFFKLLSLAGAYWRGSEKNKMLTRIYGTCFPNQKELDEYLANLEEAKKRDHRKLGRELDLFTFSDLVGSGFPLYTPKGALLRRLITQYIEDLQSAQDYTQVWTPQVAKADLFKTSGHYDKYKDDMFTVHSHYSNEEFFLKPMNCPQHTQIYASKSRSYRDLPLRLTDFAMLYRDEKPGELSGLARVRSFSQDDCHIFCREDQVDKEIDIALAMIKQVMTTFGFKYRYRLSTRDPNHPEKYLGHPEIWEKVEKWAVEIMQRNQIDYYDAPGEAAFYAPKMDLMATDALGREWQLSTVQIDYVQPERFGLYYIDSTGQKQTPVMIHRAIVGSPERFLMILLEHYGGAFPTWLSPVQVKILPIADRHFDYATQILKEFKSVQLRAELDIRSESLQAKIRDAQLEKDNYMLIMGDKDVAANVVSIRTRKGLDLGQKSIGDFIRLISQEIADKVNSY